MNTETISRSRVGQLFIKILAAGMESGFRHHFFAAGPILAGVECLTGQKVLEVGCGTGFFTIPAAVLIGESGSLTAMDILPGSVELVSQKVQEAGLRNVRVVQGDALDTQFEPGSFDTVLLFGVVPAPMLPMPQLLTEIHRILKAEGMLAVWPPVPGWLPHAVTRSGSFVFCSRRNGVHNFRRC